MSRDPARKSTRPAMSRSHAPGPAASSAGRPWTATFAPHCTAVVMALQREADLCLAALRGMHRAGFGLSFTFRSQRALAGGHARRVRPSPEFDSRRAVLLSVHSVTVLLDSSRVSLKQIPIVECSITCSHSNRLLCGRRSHAEVRAGEFASDACASESPSPPPSGAFLGGRGEHSVCRGNY